MEKNKGHGFLSIDIQKEDYVLSGWTKLPNIVLQENGQWADFLPISELQARNGLETSNCTVYGTLNCIETLYKRLFNDEVNYSERYIGIITETTPEGNNVQKVIEAIRKNCGLIPEKLLPFDSTINEWDEYYSPKPMTSDLLWKGKEWLVEYKVLHEWIFGIGDRNKIDRIKQGLKYSPIGISVWLGERNEKGLYVKPSWAWYNHWVMIYGYEEGRFWRVFDHYDNVHKKLAWDYDFGWAKRYHLERKLTTEEKEEIYTRIQLALNKIREAINIIQEKINQLKRSLEESLGKIFKGK